MPSRFEASFRPQTIPFRKGVNPMRLFSSLACFPIFAVALSPGFAAAQGAGPSSATPAAQAPADCADVPALKSSVENMKKNLADWPNLGRYRDANEKIAPPTKNEKRVVFMGDSITDGWTNPQFGGFFPGKPYIDRGISGQTTPQMLIRFRSDVIALRPKVVVILAGTNDLAGNTGTETVSEIEDNLSTMTDLARAHSIHVVLASVTPVSNYGPRREGRPAMTVGRPPEKILELNTWMKKYVLENGYTYLDYFSATVDDKGFLKKELSEDGLHPNAKGYAVMGPLAEQAIQSALKKKH
jgi:lysophospholipase L1-like esterase